MKKLLALVVLVALLASARQGTCATIIGSPGLPGFGIDDGTHLFLPGQQVISVKLFDPANTAGFPSAFGFFFASAPGTPEPFFFPGDMLTSPQGARINFSTGEVRDADQPGEPVVHTFTPRPGPIGFVYLLDLTSVGGPGFTLFTVPSLNTATGMLDAAATWPSVSDPSFDYLIGFEAFDTTSQDFVTLSILGVKGVSPVPEPASLLLLGAGLIVLAAGKRRSKS